MKMYNKRLSIQCVVIFLRRIGFIGTLINILHTTHLAAIHISSYHLLVEITAVLVPRFAIISAKPGLTIPWISIH
jgi:hypothetical protein